MENQWIVMAIEAYSRYTLILPYVFKPDWPQIEADFNARWLEEMINLMRQGRICTDRAANRTRYRLV
ncbi:hypothetical protein P4S72_18920 [Vibrio sp. PP-XX7]